MMVSRDRRASHGIAQENSLEDHAHIHQHTVGGDPVFPCIFHKLDIIEHTHNRHRDIAHQLGGAVAAGL